MASQPTQQNEETSFTPEAVVHVVQQNHQDPQPINNHVFSNSHLNQSNGTEEDEWGESVDPVKITPTYGVAPLASHDEESFNTSSLNHQQQTYEQQVDYNQQQQTVQYESEVNGAYNEHHNQQQEQPAEQQTTTYASENGVTAVALYDYQAADEDEISFDPNDIITNIEQVRSFKLFQKEQDI